MQTKIWLRAAALAIVVATGLAGCGGSNDDDNGNAGTAPAQNDSFFADVTRIVGTTSETTEPVAVEGITATAPEASEASPLL